MRLPASLEVPAEPDGEPEAAARRAFLYSDSSLQRLLGA